MAQARVANDEAHQTGEGPFWDPVRQQLLWVDIPRGLVFAGDLLEDGTIAIRERVQFPGTTGAVAVAEAGDWLVAGGQELLVRAADGSVTPGPRILPQDSGRRLNDGKPDPAGRYVVGSLDLEQRGEQSEVLVRVEDDGAVTLLDDDLTLSNGLGWTADGRRFYSVDTERSRIHMRSYDPETGEVGPRSVFVEVEGGHPDGMCLDAEEHLWVAVYGGGRVNRYSPDGTLVSAIEIPTALQTTCPAFAGPDLDTLVITTAAQNLDATQLAAQPDAGRIFTVKPGVRGLPQTLWNGALPGSPR
ncbi:MAG: SMP-30/gluconolactonase/LRE family protein [Naasia sp.]|nr:SMP-30/gluconolactonase/LRE family protein [Naasia sp.]